jgi:hypothetical protein
MRPLALLAVAVGACGLGGHVDVIAYSARAMGPMSDLRVVFEDPDGSTRTARTDSDGHAGGNIVAGGTVWFEDADLMQSPGFLTARTNVHPGDTVEIGPRGALPHTSRATMQVTGTPPSGASVLVVTADCYGGPGSALYSMMLDDRCQTTAEVLILAVDQASGASSFLVGYIWIPAQPIVDGGTITVDPSAWQPPQAVALDFVNAGGSVDYTVQSAFPNAFYPSSPPGLTIPVGALVAQGSVGAPTSFEITFPASAAATPIDLDQILPPAVTTETQSNGDVKWSATGDASRVAGAIVTEYDWVHQSSPGYQVPMTLRIIADADSEGVISPFKLPGALSTFAPNEGFMASSGRAALVRFTGFADADPKRMVDVPFDPGLELRNVDRSYQAAPMWSVAKTSFP